MYVNFLAESNVGMIFSETKCVGKSLSLFILGRGQGIPERVHMMFLSGGNQMMCGTSMYVGNVWHECILKLFVHIEFLAQG